MEGQGVFGKGMVLTMAQGDSPFRGFVDNHAEHEALAATTGSMNPVNEIYNRISESSLLPIMIP